MLAFSAALFALIWPVAAFWITRGRPYRNEAPRGLPDEED